MTNDKYNTMNVAYIDICYIGNYCQRYFKWNIFENIKFEVKFIQVTMPFCGIYDRYKTHTETYPVFNQSRNFIFGNLLSQGKSVGIL